jgi:hypothetical protein
MSLNCLSWFWAFSSSHLLKVNLHPLLAISKEQVQPIIDKIADQLPGWKADLMTRAGRVIQRISRLGLLKPLTRSDGPSCGEAERRQRGVTVSLLGLKCVALVSLGALGLLI